MSATTITVTAIRVRTNTDNMFDGNTSDEIAAIDVDATIEAYLGEVAAELAVDYPQARIDVDSASVYRTEVGIDTDQDNTDNEEVWTVRQGVEDAVTDGEARVWERGNFWVVK